ncbi:DNA internalization-related competence protein ComEC/Rec2 [Imhoffiella purpurea]|uniref:Putative hydrolase of the metallo-beta-lactamase superfamily n=1 Tax=Imhoffiella purpurea TaxID=1249627 RepID=W9V444_9GAMM|nr:DNA internalization-related competence protein ComEC/Rec2 [Imhoffiella purpurea]EXJ14293.1 Putative hydrolase of the metallo-beta-lactamase superfamily [Imhoffiella purpurea]
MKRLWPPVFVAGVLSLYLSPGMPAWAVAAAILTALGLRCKDYGWSLIAAFALGLAWGQIHVPRTSSDPFPETLARTSLTIEGRIASIPVRSGGARRFLFDVERSLNGGAPLPFRGRVRLSWYRDAPVLRAGERWRLEVRLKPPHGYANPGGFDYERWLFEQGVGATGYVRKGAERLDAGPGSYRLARWRQRLSEHIDQVLEGAPAAGLIRALTVGDRSGLDADDWDALTRTGTNHLVAISGLHVGLIAGGVWLAVRWLWSCGGRLALLMAAPRAAAIAALLAALGYAALAGFAVSTQRALIMLAVLLGALYWGRALRPYHAWSMALLAVVIWDPLAVLSYGFWLSFGAVGLLLFGLGQRLGRRGRLAIWWRAQWVVAIGLAPLVLLFFDRASVIAPLVNLVAVPLFGLLLPLVLLASLLSLIPGASLPLVLISDLLGRCLHGLVWLGGQDWAAYSLSERPLWAWVVAVAGALLLLAPRGLPGRWLGLILLLPVPLLPPSVPPYGAAWVHLLDVGQGLAILVRTRDGTLIFDTGPRYPGGFDTGRQIVLPFLRAKGIERIDRLVISHADRDHSGGASALIREIEVGAIQSGEPEALDLPGATPCRSGDFWRWSGVEFRFLHPETVGGQGNDASCVLRITAGGRSILMTGDVGRAVEARLVERFGDDLRSEILVAGHHGSATSTSAVFIDRVAPEWVLYASGYANRFGFPSPEVRDRVDASGADSMNTATAGAIEVRLKADGGIEGPTGWRSQAAGIWIHRP